MPIRYDDDMAAWADEQAGLIRSGRLDLLDLVNLAEEIESLGKSEQRELATRMVVLFAHLLKWRFQPSHRGRSWALTIATQRGEVDALLADSPSLRFRLRDVGWMERTWDRAVILARQETELDDFPATCPWSVEDVLDRTWMPAD